MSNKNNDTSIRESIDVISPYPIRLIESMEIIGELGEHIQLKLSGILSEDKGADCIEQVRSNDEITVWANKSDDKVSLFKGVTTEANISFRDGVYYIDITALSWTSMLDYEKKRRSFQNESNSFSTVISKIIEECDGADWNSNVSQSSEKTGRMFLQYDETDWEFCKRMASHFNTHLVADGLAKKPYFSLGLARKNKEITNVSEIAVSRDSLKYEKAINKGDFSIEQDFVKYTVLCDEIIGLGDTVEYKGYPLTVERYSYYLDKQVLKKKYDLVMDSSLSVDTYDNNIKGISLIGKVVESNNQQVKLKLSIDKEDNDDNTCWFSYASQANNLFYCMPEIGTTVSLYFQNNNETSALAMNAVRKNGGSCSKTSNPALKYMGTPDGKEFKLGVDDIDFSAHEELFMKMQDSSGFKTKSHVNLNIFTKQKLSIEAKELVKIFAQTGNIVVGANQESSLFLMGATSGDAHMRAANDLIYTGRKREVFTDRLNEEIAYTEKKFEWGKLAKNVLIGLAAVALVVAVVATGSAALVGVGAIAASTATAAVTGAAITGVVAVGTMAVTDMIRGEVSDAKDYFLAGIKGAIEGAISGALMGIKALEGMKLIRKMFFSGGVAFLTDAVTQGIDILFNNGKYDWKQGLLSFGIGFISPAIAKGVQQLIKKCGNKMPGWLRKGLCIFCGGPIDVIRGSCIYENIDFELPGPTPLVWRRIWCSASQIMGHLGHGTRYNYEMGLEVVEEEHAIIVYLVDGRACAFPELWEGESYFNYENRIVLKRESDHYTVYEPETRYSYLFYPSDHGYMQYKLCAVKNSLGHRIQFFYGENGYLNKIIDSVGRVLWVSTNQVGRIVQIALEGYRNEPGYTLVSYDYNEEQDLETVTDAMGLPLKMKYRNHLMIQKTDRNRSSFYWEYDKYEYGARVVRSWGDGDVLSVWIEYHDKEQYNLVRTTANGVPTEYHYDDRMLCTRIVYPDLSETRSDYDDNYNLISRIDEEGRLTSYKYNQNALLTTLVNSDSSKTELVFDENDRIIEAIDPEGNSKKWYYNADDTVEKMIDEMGEETRYCYNENKLLSKIVYANSAEVSMEYDLWFNMNRLVLSDGSEANWKYDARGNCIATGNQMGAKNLFQYDKLNRLIGAELSDGSKMRIAYDAYDSIIYAKDNRAEIECTYTILGDIASRKQGNRKVEYAYNSENQLLSITNEKGEKYQFERDSKGNIIKETGFDQITRKYVRDQSGLVTQVIRPDNRYSRFIYDKVGRVIRTDYHDKSFEAFRYNKNGQLIEAENQFMTLKLDRDAAGRIVKENQDLHWVESKYNARGERIQTTTSFGANLLSNRNEMGQITHFVAYMDKNRAWSSQMEYNQFGQEVERKVSGEIYSSFSYDNLGRPVEHRVSGYTGTVEHTKRHRTYSWSVNDQLRAVTNELTKSTISYTYDQFSNLIGSKEIGVDSIIRQMDEVGNIFNSSDCSDRIYEAGSRLVMSDIDLKEKRNTFQGGYGKLVTKGVEYFYDEEGNLSRKEEANGDVWYYTYYGNGMLKNVVKPDKTVIQFKYDPMGRRIEKAVLEVDEEITPIESIREREKAAEWQVIGGVRIRKPMPEKEKNIIKLESYRLKKNAKRITRYLWNGNTIIHEWEDDDQTSWNESKKKIAYQADYLKKLEKQKAIEESAKMDYVQPDSLITWVFEDSYIPRAKITKEGCYSIISDYLGTPVEAYDESGVKVWTRELDINGNMKKPSRNIYGIEEPEIGERNFIPFRFQGQYEDEETGLYYNRFRYYDPKIGQYTQPDPIGLEGGNPTLYGYVYNTLAEIDPFGLTWKDLLDSGLGHHLFPRSIAKKFEIEELAKLTALSWYPNNPANTGELHQQLHQLLVKEGVPYHGSKFTGTVDDFFRMAEKAYDGIETQGYLKIPGSKKKKFNNLTPKEGVKKIEELYRKGELPNKCT